MKTRMTFDSEIEGDDYKLKQCLKASDMASALWEITHNLKKKLESIFEGVDNTNNDVFDGLDSYAQAIHEILENYNINTDELC